MPGQTPIFAFPYPCPDEVITAQAFTDLANAIDAKLLDVNADMVFALNRPNVDQLSGTQVINPGVVTTLTVPNSSYVIPVAGVWAFRADITIAATPPTVTYQRAQVFQNAVFRFGFTQDSDGNIAVACRPVGPLVAAAGDVITVTMLYTGTGTMTVQAAISAKLLCRIP